MSWKIKKKKIIKSEIKNMHFTEEVYLNCIFNTYAFKYLDRSCDKGDDTSYPILALYLMYEFNC